MKTWPTAVALGMLVATWGILHSLSHGEPFLAKKPFAEFPLTLGERWQGRELGLAPYILEVLKLTDYMMRAYVPTAQARGNGHEAMGKVPEKRTASPVFLYVGYYQSQRTGATYHSPKNCLPGAGWQIIEHDQVTVSLRDQQPVTINKVLIQKGLDQQVILYWYQDRGRVIASEYWAKAYLIWDAMTQNRTDGAMVRISVPVTITTQAAYQQGLSFLDDLWPVLQAYLPGEGGAS